MKCGCSITVIPFVHSGECAVIDEKYDILKHPNLKLTVDGGSGHYLHGGTEMQ